MANERDDEERIKNGTWVPALVLESPVTPQQRARNFAFYQRIRDGVEGDYRQGGLKQFVFEVPLDSCSVGPASPSNGHRSHVTFRIDPASDCYRRLVSYIVGHTDVKCDADDRVEYLTKRVEQLLGKLDKACAMVRALYAGEGDGLARVEREAAFLGWFEQLREDVAGIRAEVTRTTEAR